MGDNLSFIHKHKKFLFRVFTSISRLYVHNIIFYLSFMYINTKNFLKNKKIIKNLSVDALP